MKNSLHYVFWFWLPPLGYMIGIFYVSSLSDPQVGVDAPDYMLHSIGYFLLTLLLIRLFLAEQPRILLKLANYLSGSENTGIGFLFWSIASLAGVVTAVFYGITDELHQYFTPGRYCSFRDVLANALGAFLAYGISMLDYLILNRTSFQKKLINRLKLLGGISYAGHITPKPKTRFAGLRLSTE